MEAHQHHILFGFLFFLSGLLLPACGGDQSLQQLLFVSTEDESRTDVLLETARLDYDTENYASAEAKTAQILRSDPKNRAAILLKGNTELAMASLGLLDIVTRILDDASTSSSSTDTADTLNTLGNLVLNLTSADYAMLGTKTDVSSNSILSGIEGIAPNYPGDFMTAGDPRHDLEALRLLNQAIKTVCPLISADVLAVDPGNSRYQCDVSLGSDSVQASLIFFTAHFVEALIFNAVLLYQESSSTSALHLLADGAEKQSNVFKQISALETASKQDQTSFSALTDLTDAISEVTKNVQAIFDTTSGSMLASLMLDLRTAVDVIGAIDGVPSDFTKSLTSALDQIEETAKSAGESTSGLSDQTSALKQKLSGQIVSKLNTQMTTFFSKVDTLKEESGGDLSTCQQAKVKDMCSQSTSIVADFDSISTPSGCDTYTAADTGDTDAATCTD